MAQLVEVFQSEQLSKRPPIWAMIETPASAFDKHGIPGIVDFVCVRTNDLSYFILAMSRGSQGKSFFAGAASSPYCP